MIESISIGLTLTLLVANHAWYYWGRRYKRAVPGTLEHERCARLRRRWRWMGFGFWVKQAAWWPYYIGRDLAKGHYVWVGVDLIFTVVLFFLVRIDWRKLKKELEEDEDDWFNKAKKSGKKALASVKQAASSLVAGPVPVGAGA